MCARVHRLSVDACNINIMCLHVYYIIEFRYWTVCGSSGTCTCRLVLDSVECGSLVQAVQFWEPEMRVKMFSFPFCLRLGLILLVVCCIIYSVCNIS